MTDSEIAGRSDTLHDVGRGDLTRGKMRGFVGKGEAERLGTGTYALRSDLEHLSASERYRHTVWRRWNRVQLPGAVVSHLSAAALWDLPLPHPMPTTMHLSGLKKIAGQSTSEVTRHSTAVPQSAVTERYGMPCTSLARTVIDVAMTESADTGIMVADTALWMAVEQETGLDALDVTADYPEAVELVRTGWQHQLDQRKGRKGIRQARDIAAFADWRSESPGESVTRLRLHQIGLPQPQLQVQVPSPTGTMYRLDFLLYELGVFIEFDGAATYETDPALAKQQLMREKQREDWIRAKTGWRCVRLTWWDISSVTRFRQVMAQHGLLP